MLPGFNDFMNCCKNKNQPTTICATHNNNVAPAIVKTQQPICASRATEMLRHTHHKSCSCNGAKRKSKATMCFTCDRVAPSHTPQELLLQWCKARV